MPMPRKPKSEPPKVTLTWQRRQMLQMEQTIVNLRASLTSQNERLRETQAQLDRAIKQIEESNRDRDFHASHNLALSQRATLAESELRYLHGFYDGVDRILKHGKANETDRRAGSGNPQGAPGG